MCAALRAQRGDGPSGLAYTVHCTHWRGMTECTPSYAGRGAAASTPVPHGRGFDMDISSGSRESRSRHSALASRGSGVTNICVVKCVLWAHVFQTCPSQTPVISNLAPAEHEMRSRGHPGRGRRRTRPHGTVASLSHCARATGHRLLSVSTHMPPTGPCLCVLRAAGLSHRPAPRPFLGFIGVGTAFVSSPRASPPKSKHLTNQKTTGSSLASARPRE